MSIIITYDIRKASVGSCSATGYIMTKCLKELHVPLENFKWNDVTLYINGIPEDSRLEMLKAFIEDLIWLRNRGVQIQLTNKVSRKNGE